MTKISSRRLKGDEDVFPMWMLYVLGALVVVAILIMIATRGFNLG
jgi:hypothetical protein